VLKIIALNIILVQFVEFGLFYFLFV